MRRFEESTFVFISTNLEHMPDGPEELWLPVMHTLADKGANVRFLAQMHSPLEEWVRGLGVEVDPYILDRWNVIRAHTRLRKYLRRYMPVVAHSTGLEADLLLRWAARKVPQVAVAHTMSADPQATRRRKPIERAFRAFDDVGMRKHADAVFVPDEELASEVREMGIATSNVIIDPIDTDDEVAHVARHLDVYRKFMAQRGTL